MLDIDLTGESRNNNPTSTTTAQTPENVTNLNGPAETTDLNKTSVETPETPKTAPKDENETKESSTGVFALEPGTSVEYDGKTYHINAEGDMVDEAENVFKKASEVDDFLKANQVEESNESVINSIKSALNLDLKDENGNDIEFADTTDGIISLVSTAFENKNKEIADATINKLFSDKPYLKSLDDYVTVHGSIKGFSDRPDRTGIRIDKDNVEQQKSIIKMYYSEVLNKNISDKYMNYLDDSGSLYEEAEDALKNIKAFDKANADAIAKQAEERREADVKATIEYFENVRDIINKKDLGVIKLPDTVVRTIDGKKYTSNLNDFFDYVSKPKYDDGTGNKVTAYMRDYSQRDADTRIKQDLFDAWCRFTGVTYEDLIKSYAAKKEVNDLKKQAASIKVNSKTIKVTPSKTSGINDILL